MNNMRQSNTSLTNANKNLPILLKLAFSLNHQSPQRTALPHKILQMQSLALTDACLTIYRKRAWCRDCSKLLLIARWITSWQARMTKTTLMVPLCTINLASMPWAYLAPLALVWLVLHPSKHRLGIKQATILAQIMQLHRRWLNQWWCNCRI